MYIYINIYIYIYIYIYIIHVIMKTTMMDSCNKVNDEQSCIFKYFHTRIYI